MRWSASALVTSLLALPLAAATIDVRIANANGSPVSDAVVYAIPAVPISIGHKVAQMDQKNRAFVPHVLPIQTGTWVEFPNSDDIRHQVYSLSPTRRFQLPLYTGKPAFPIQFNTPGVVVLGCNVHENMSAYIVVVDTPYFATAEAGHTTLQGLTPGQYTLHAWYPGIREELQVSVTLGEQDQKSVSFVAKR